MAEVWFDCDVCLFDNAREKYNRKKGERENEEESESDLDLTKRENRINLRETTKENHLQTKEKRGGEHTHQLFRRFFFWLLSLFVFC